MKYNIPLVNVRRQNIKIQKEINSAIKRVINDSAFILGKYTEEFEKNFARYCGVKYCIGVSSGTDALLLSYLALGIKNLDEIISVPNTAFPTTEPLGLIGAKPVFVDVNPKTYLMDPEKIVPKITRKTKAIVPVHLYGQIADMEKIMRIARKFKLKVIEDCAQAHGAEYKGKKAGTFGDLGIYSFYPGKNLGALGDAGCIVTNNRQYADFCRKFRDHGRATKYEHEFEGCNARMSGIQASVLSVKLKHLDLWVKKRRVVAEKYNRLLPENIKKPFEERHNKHAYHQYVIETDFRDKLLNFLRSKGIKGGIHYPIPLHKQKAYEHLHTRKGSLPVSEKASRRILSLPIFPEITDKEVKFVASTVKSFFVK